MKELVKEPKDGGDLIRLAESLRWPTRSRASHSQVIVYPPGANPVTVGLRSGGDFRAFNNAKAALRRAGLFDQAADRRTIEVDDRRETVQRHRDQSEALIARINAAAAAEGASSLMAGRRAELYELVRRCENVGWPTRAIGTDQSHITVTPPGKRPVTIATGSSIKDYPTQILSQLTRAGLLEAEAARDAAAEQARRQRITDDRARGGVAPEDCVSQDDPPPSSPNTDADTADAAQQVGDVPGGLQQVDGVGIAEWAWAKTPIGAVDRKATELLLEDGRIRYACWRGDYVATNWQAISKHRKTKHPDDLSPTAKRRAAAAASAAEASAAEAVDPAPHAAAPPIVDLKTRAGTLLFQAPDSSTPRLAQVLGADRVAAHAMTADAAQATAAASAPQAPAEPDPDPTPLAPAPAPAPAPVLPVTPRPPARREDPLPEPRRVDNLPPTVRAGISTVATASRSNGSSNGSGVPAAVGTGTDLGDMVSRMRRLAGVDAERALLETEVTGLRADLARARAQGAQLADQCIAKDQEITRLRARVAAADARIAADAAAVAAANELQQLLSTLMGGGSAPLAA